MKIKQYLFTFICFTAFEIHDATDCKTYNKITADENHQQYILHVGKPFRHYRVKVSMKVSDTHRSHSESPSPL